MKPRERFLVLDITESQLEYQLTSTFSDLCSQCSIIINIYLLYDCNVDEKLINWFQKELENFIWAKFEDYNPKRTSPKALRTALPIRSQDILTWVSFFEAQGSTSNDSLRNPDLSIIVVVRWPLTRWKRNVIF